MLLSMTLKKETNFDTLMRFYVSFRSQYIFKMIDGRNDVELLCKIFVLKYYFMCYTECDIFENI
jgi:hypothetical protein